MAGQRAKACGILGWCKTKPGSRPAWPRATRYDWSHQPATRNQSGSRNPCGSSKGGVLSPKSPGTPSPAGVTWLAGTPNDFDAVRADPKPVVGFSDITYLHLALWRHCRVPGIHGCLAGATAISAVRQLLMTTDPLVLQRDNAAVSAAGCTTGSAAWGFPCSEASSAGMT
jgi:hypothetical protein